MAIEVVDLRVTQPSKPRGETKTHFRLNKDGSVLVREREAIVGIGLHQTAIRFGVSPQAIKQNGGDAKLAKDFRAANVAAHVVLWLYPPGPPRIVLVNPFRWHVNHGNGLNPFTIGLEVEGKFPGRCKPEDFELEPAQVQALEECLELIVAVAAHEAITLTHLWGHRQSNGEKPGDPGPELWKRGAIDVAQDKLGLKLELDRAFPPSTPRVTPGLPIPHDWDPRSTHPYR